MESSLTPNNDNPFIERMEKYEDKEILDVIKNGADYQSQGVEAAIRIAIKRELISQDEGEKLLNYTIEKIAETEAAESKVIEKNRSKGRVEMVVGVILFISGLIYTIQSSHYIWIGALIFGPVMFIRGLFR